MSENCKRFTDNKRTQKLRRKFIPFCVSARERKKVTSHTRTRFVRWLVEAHNAIRNDPERESFARSFLSLERGPYFIQSRWMNVWIATRPVWYLLSSIYSHGMKKVPAGTGPLAGLHTPTYTTSLARLATTKERTKWRRNVDIRPKYKLTLVNIKWKSYPYEEDLAPLSSCLRLLDWLWPYEKFFFESTFLSFNLSLCTTILRLRRHKRIWAELTSVSQSVAARRRRRSYSETFLGCVGRTTLACSITWPVSVLVNTAYYNIQYFD